MTIMPEKDSFEKKIAEGCYHCKSQRIKQKIIHKKGLVEIYFYCGNCKKYFFGDSFLDDNVLDNKILK